MQRRIAARRCCFIASPRAWCCISQHGAAVQASDSGNARAGGRGLRGGWAGTRSGTGMVGSERFERARRLPFQSRFALKPIISPEQMVLLFTYAGNLLLRGTSQRFPFQVRPKCLTYTANIALKCPKALSPHR